MAGSTMADSAMAGSAMAGSNLTGSPQPGRFPSKVVSFGHLIGRYQNYYFFNLL